MDHTKPVKPTLWHEREFLKLWSGETVSQLGSQVSVLAIPLAAVTVLHASTFQVGVLTAMETVPFLLVSLLAGAWVDRVRRRAVLIVSDVGRAALLATVPLGAALGWLSMGQLYAVALTTGVLTVFFDVAYQSYLPSLIDRSQLVDGNSKLQVSESGAQIIGPGMAGWLIGALGAARAVATDAASFVVSAVAVLVIRKPEPAPNPGATAEAKRSMWAEIGEGLRFVLGHPYLRNIAGCTSTFNLFSSFTNAVILVFAVRQLHLSPAVIGLILSTASIGFLVGALFAGKAAKRFGLGRALVGSLLVGGVGPFLLPWANRADAIPLLIGGYLIGAFGVPIYNINQLSLRQSITPDRLQGRMNATMRFLVWGCMPLGALLGGTLGSAVGIRTTLWIAACGQLSAVLWLLWSPVRHLVTIPTLDSDPDPESGAAATPVEADPDPAVQPAGQC